MAFLSLGCTMPASHLLLTQLEKLSRTGARDRMCVMLHACKQMRVDAEKCWELSCFGPAGGMKARQEDDEELRGDQRRARVWKLLKCLPKRLSSGHFWSVCMLASKLKSSVLASGRYRTS